MIYTVIFKRTVKSEYDSASTVDAVSETEAKKIIKNCYPGSWDLSIKKEDWKAAHDGRLVERISIAPPRPQRAGREVT